MRLGNNIYELPRIPNPIFCKITFIICRGARGGGGRCSPTTLPLDPPQSEERMWNIPREEMGEHLFNYCQNHYGHILWLRLLYPMATPT